MRKKVVKMILIYVENSGWWGQKNETLAGPRNRTWVCSATTNCTNHYTRPARMTQLEKQQTKSSKLRYIYPHKLRFLYFKASCFSLI
ncbi:hypothetical protein QG37_03769 [Candidozyma auris]|uniref:Uncharacterized protein n=1 Tax=Candidozyma auris TaxID=498019 RepID=A0A0L0NZR0_CANAR|nr:hypothetical protein QG37_03769 [[Candida] auris]